MSTQEHPTAP